MYTKSKKLGINVVPTWNHARDEALEFGEQTFESHVLYTDGKATSDTVSVHASACTCVLPAGYRQSALARLTC